MKNEVAQVKWQVLVPVPLELAPDLFCAQHTYTPACDGWHPPGPCPPSRAPVRVEAEAET